jgi:hypothetical protein
MPVANLCSRLCFQFMSTRGTPQLSNAGLTPSRPSLSAPCHPTHLRELSDSVPSATASIRHCWQPRLQAAVHLETYHRQNHPRLAPAGVPRSPTSQQVSQRQLASALSTSTNRAILAPDTPCRAVHLNRASPASLPNTRVLSVWLRSNSAKLSTPGAPSTTRSCQTHLNRGWGCV